MLEERLGLQSERLKNQELQRQKFETIERMFDSNEAIVLKQGNNVLIRMAGLNFKSGKSNIDTPYFSLLKKVQRAINVYPYAKVIIEGHTDAFGGDLVILMSNNQNLLKPKTIRIVLFIFLLLFFDITLSKDGVVELSNKIKENFRFNSVSNFIYYQCNKNTPCRLHCTHNGSTFLSEEIAQSAYFGERKRALDGAIIGYVLVLEEKKAWATLARESSCYFEGMHPEFIYKK